MKHKKQQTDFGCVYATLSMVLGGDESFYWNAITNQAEQIQKGKRKYGAGSNSYEVSKFLSKYNYEHKLIILDSNIKDIFWLEQLSNRYPIYVSGTFLNKGERGRPSKRHHAFAIYDGNIYDPAEDFELDYNACSHYTDLNIDNVIVIFKENEQFGKSK